MLHYNRQNNLTVAFPLVALLYAGRVTAEGVADLIIRKVHISSADATTEPVLSIAQTGDFR